jgi:hypothetical protein
MKISSYLKIQFLSEAAGFLVAAWIYPNGKVLDCGALSHISFVLKSPQKFGLTDDDIKGCTHCQDDASSKYPRIERITTYMDGIESRAWDEVMRKVLEKGFIRVRKVKSNARSYIWFIDIYEFNSRTKKTLSNWAYDLGSKNNDTKVMFSVMRGDEPKNMTIESLSNLTEEHEPLEMTTLNEVTDIDYQKLSK